MDGFPIFLFYNWPVSQSFPIQPRQLTSPRLLWYDLHSWLPVFQPYDSTRIYLYYEDKNTVSVLVFKSYVPYKSIKLLKQLPIRTVRLSHWFFDSSRDRFRTSFWDLRCSILLLNLSISISNSWSLLSTKDLLWMAFLSFSFCFWFPLSTEISPFNELNGVDVNEWENSCMADLSWISCTRCSTTTLFRT